MTKWVDKDVQKIIKKQIENVASSRTMLTDEQIDDVMQRVLKHHKAHAKDNEVYEEDGVSYLWFEMPELNQKPKTLQTRTEDGKTKKKFRIACRTKLGWIGFFGWNDFWKPCEDNEIYWARGKLRTQYDIKGTWGTGEYTDSEGETKKKLKRLYAKSLEEACKKTGMNIDDLDEDDLDLSYTMEAWQNLG